MGMVRELLDIVTIIIALAPIGIKIFRKVGLLKTFNDDLCPLA